MDDAHPIDSRGPDSAAENYLIGVDGSGPSLAALRWGLRRAESLSARVVVVHVQEPSDPFADGDSVLEAAVAVAARSHPSVRVTPKRVAGTVAEELARLAAEGELLIVGTHKTGYLRGRAIGSRSVFVASLARSSVAIVPDVSLVSRRGVVVGLDARNASASAVRFAAMEADRLHQPLILQSAEERPPARPDDRGASGAPRASLREAAELAISLVPDLEVHSRFSTRAASEALLDASRSASLLILDESGFAQLGRPIIGPVAHDVLMNINSPVLIARLPIDDDGAAPDRAAPASISGRRR